MTGEPSEPARRVAYAYAFGGPGRFVDLDGRSPLDFVKKVVDNQTIVYRAARDVVAELAADQTGAAQRILDDPFANPLAKDLARVSKLLSSSVDCAADIDAMVPFFLTRGRGGKAASATVPRNLAEKLTLAEAKGGAGQRIMQGRIKDSRYPEAVWAKMQHVHYNSGGSKIVVHYWENLQTGAREGFKFK